MSGPQSVKSASFEHEGNTIRVVSTRTGLPMETLRAWERRYGFPSPDRRPGSNRRLYSAADMERLVAVQRALDRGYRVGDVIGKTVYELDELNQAPKDSAQKRLQVEPSGVSVEELIELLACDRILELEAQLRRGALTLGPRRFVTDLAHPFAVSVGQAWADGRLSVRHEHHATECLVTQLRQMLANYQDIKARPLVLLATLPGEPHTLALQMVALYLVVAGAKPRLLGGSTPANEIVQSATALGADVVGLTVTPTSDRKQARKDAKALRRGLPAHVPLWIGGTGAAALGFDDETVRVVTSWDAIDQALAQCRARSQRRRLAK
jgi:DNA-binding transcriptional MerR regulator